MREIFYTPEEARVVIEGWRQQPGRRLSAHQVHCAPTIALQTGMH